MRRLMLLRHAKSSWDHPGMKDIDRPLAPRGRRAAPLMGRFISRQGLLPEVVLCSSAVRAQQTWALVVAEWDRSGHTASPRIEMHTALYLASVSYLTSTIKRLDKDVQSVMIVGHNPAMAQLASGLAGYGDSWSMQSMEKKFPTAALAIVDFSIDSWREIRSGEGNLRKFTRPKDLL